MKCTRIPSAVGVCVLSAVLGAMPFTATASSYLPLGNGVDHIYNGVPFEIWGFGMDTRHTPGDTSVPEPIILSATRDLSPYGTAKRLHIIQHCAWADNVPTGITVGHITVSYQDGSTSTCDLVVGVNTAEWSYDNPSLQSYLQHDKVPPAYSGPVDDNGDGIPEYYGHLFYVSIELDAKPLAGIELRLDEASYTNPDWYYGYAAWDWFGISVLALTIEYPPIPASLNIDPDTLNLQSKGEWITAYVGLPEGFDVANIEPESIRLNGQVPAVRSQIDDEGQVLMIKFDRAAVARIVGTGEVQITVTGIMAGNTKFEGVDTIRVIDPGAGKK
jgi:hypothetical protein